MSFPSPKAPDTWILIASVLGAAGLLVSAAGWVANVSWLRMVGMVLLAPIIVGGIGLMLFVIPFLVIANHRSRKNPSQTRNDT
jgi:hypothetical protein